MTNTHPINFTPFVLETGGQRERSIEKKRECLLLTCIHSAYLRACYDLFFPHCLIYDLHSNTLVKQKTRAGLSHALHMSSLSYPSFPVDSYLLHMLLSPLTFSCSCLLLLQVNTNHLSRRPFKLRGDKGKRRI